MTSYLNRLLDALVLAEKRAVSPVKPNVDAKPFFIWSQEAFPYLTNRIAESTINPESAEDLEERLYTVIVRLVIAHLGTGYKGEKEALLYELIPLLEDEFTSNRWLLDGQGAELVPELSAIGLEPNRTRGLVVFQNAGIAVQQVGTEFVLQVSFAIDVQGRV